MYYNDGGEDYDSYALEPPARRKQTTDLLEELSTPSVFMVRFSVFASVCLLRALLALHACMRACGVRPRDNCERVATAETVGCGLSARSLPNSIFSLLHPHTHTQVSEVDVDALLDSYIDNIDELLQSGTLG